MTLASTVWTHGWWAPYCRGRKAATPSPSGTVPEMATAHVRVRLAARATLVACLQGPPPDASEEVWPQGFRDPAVPGGAEPPHVEVGGVPPDVGVAGGKLVHAQRPGVARANRRVVSQPDFCSGDRACPGPKCRHMFLAPRRASALVHHQVSRVLRRGSCVPVVWKRWTKASRHPGWLVGSCLRRQ